MKFPAGPHPVSRSTVTATTAPPVPDLQPVRRRSAFGVLGWGAILIATVVVAPILAVVSNIFAPGTGTWTHLAATVLPDYIATTLRLTLGVGIGTMVFGVGTAWLVSAYTFPGRGILQWALILPLAMPAYVIAYVYTDWLQFAGPVQTAFRGWLGVGAPRLPDVRSEGGAILMFSLVLYPYVYLLARNAFLEQSAGMIEAGRQMGYSAWQSFVRIALPLARPGIAAGVALVLMETLADFGAVSYFGVQTFTTGIYRAWQSLGDQVAAAQLAAVLLGLVALILALERANRGRARFQSGNPGRRGYPQRMHGRAAALACIACTLPVILGFLLPAALLVRLALDEIVIGRGPRLIGLIGNSFMLATISAAVVTAAALILAYAARVTREAGPARVIRTANQVASLGYAIPGAVIAVGVLLPLGRLDNLIIGWAKAWFGMQFGLVLTGSLAALVFAYLVRFLAIALQSVESGLSRVTPSMDDAARGLGIPPLQILARVHAPMLRPSVLTAALLVFVDVMKELPASFALRPFNFDTLAIEIYNLAKDERLGEAALPSLLIVAVGLLPLAFLSRQMKTNDEGRRSPAPKANTGRETLSRPPPVPRLGE